MSIYRSYHRRKYLLEFIYIMF